MKEFQREVRYECDFKVEWGEIKGGYQGRFEIYV